MYIIARMREFPHTNDERIIAELIKRFAKIFTIDVSRQTSLWSNIFILYVFFNTNISILIYYKQYNIIYREKKNLIEAELYYSTC